jgi:hypothetical protein
MSLDLKELSRKLGRRAFKRFSIPGAVVFWIQGCQEPLPESGSPLSDISRGGLSFLSNEPPAIGSEISLRIVLPQNQETLELSGHVIYALLRGPRLTYRYRIGVDLKSFEPSQGGNSPDVLKTIEALERKYGKRRKSID